MELIENVTKLEHRKYGIGIYVCHCKGGKGDQLIRVFFKDRISDNGGGYKEFMVSSLDNGLLKFIIDTTIQFDKSSTQLGGRNILETTKYDNNLVFNESYTIIGDCLKAKKIHACYDITVIGDLIVDLIDVKGSLTVLGNIEANSINCQNILYCKGKVDTDKLEVGIDLIAESIQCSDLYCGGNLIVQRTIDIKNSIIEKTMVAGEGIYGSGKLSAQNSVSVEYFEYDGDITGKVYELDTDSMYGKENKKEIASPLEFSLEELIDKAKNIIIKDVSDAGVKSEDDLIEYLMQLTSTEKINTTDWFEVFTRVVDISYFDKINDFRDYLIMFYALRILPREMIEYETVEHIPGTLMEEAKNKGLELPITYRSIEDFILCLKIVNNYYEQIGFDKDELLDKIFQSVGIKYNTIKSFYVKK